MKPQDSDRDILKGIMQKGIQLPEDDRMTENIMQRLKHEPRKQSPGSPLIFNPPGILMMVFFIALAAVPFLNWLFGILQEGVQASLLVTLGEMLEKVSGFLLFSPLFVLVFAVFVVLHQLDRFLERRSLEQ